MFAGVTLHIAIRPEDDRIALNGIDCCVAIPEDHFQKLGEPFYSNNEKGFGLGLILTYKIIEQHHGKISIQSKVGLGTQVTISFPISIR